MSAISFPLYSTLKVIGSLVMTERKLLTWLDGGAMGAYMYTSLRAWLVLCVGGVCCSDCTRALLPIVNKCWPFQSSAYHIRRLNGSCLLSP